MKESNCASAFINSFLFFTVLNFITMEKVNSLVVGKSYYIQNVSNGQYLGGDGVPNVRTESLNSSPTQQWKVILATSKGSPAYYLQRVSDQKYLGDNKTSIFEASQISSETMWVVIFTGNNAIITNVAHTNDILSVNSSSTVVSVPAGTTSPNCQWNFYPAPASLKFDLQGFNNLFPSATSAKNNTAIEYTVEDSDYRIYNPQQSADTKTFTIKLDHIRGGATDDHIDLSVTFDDFGVINSISYTWSAGNDGYQIPKTVIKAVDITVEIAGAVGALETAGISEEVAAGILEAFDFCCAAYNKISKIVVNWSDNGGRFYFVAVACHTINRLCSSVSA